MAQDQSIIMQRRDGRLESARALGDHKRERDVYHVVRARYGLYTRVSDKFTVSQYTHTTERD